MEFAEETKKVKVEMGHLPGRGDETWFVAGDDHNYRSQIPQGKWEERHLSQEWGKSSKQSTKLALRFLVAKAKLLSASVHSAVVRSPTVQALEEARVFSLGPQSRALILPSSRGLSRNGPQSQGKRSLAHQPPSEPE